MRLTRVFCAAIIITVGLAAFSNSFRGPFVFDDLSSIVNNRSIRSLWPIWLVLLPPGRGSSVQGRPLVNLSLAVNYAISGTDNVVGYHVFNVILHVLAGLALLGVVRRTLALPSMPDRLRNASPSLALAAAILWVVHPLQTSAVTYMIQRAEVMMGLFYLLTMYCFIRGATSATGGKWWYLASVAACMLGAACKEVIATAPLMVLLYDRVLLSKGFVRAFRSRCGLYAGLLLTWAFLAWLVVFFGGRSATVGLGKDISPASYAQSQAVFVVQYLRLCFWPSPLTLDYGMQLPQQGRGFLLCAAVIAILLVLTVVAMRHRPAAGLAGCWFFAILAPSSSFVPVVTELAAEHRMYLPLAAVIVLVVVTAYLTGVWMIGRLIRDPSKRNGAGAIGGGLVLVVVSGALGWATFERNNDYRSLSSILWDTVSKRPSNPRAHGSLGVHLMQAGDLPGAIEQFNVAIRLDEHDGRSYFDRGLAYGKLGNNERALRDFDKAAEMTPDSTEVSSARGAAYLNMGRYEATVGEFDRVLQLDPGDVQALLSRGFAYLELGRYEKAVADFDAAIGIQPNLAKAYYYRAVSHYLLGHYDKARADVDSGLKLGVTFREEFLRELFDAMQKVRKW